jgi:hypothetical protein
MSVRITVSLGWAQLVQMFMAEDIWQEGRANKQVLQAENV